MSVREEKTKEKKFPERRMTILRGNRKLYDTNKEVPYVRIMGTWMYEAGFRPGDRIVIEVEEEKLFIRKEYAKPRRA